jgi:hypothetical protein
MILLNNPDLLKHGYFRFYTIFTSLLLDLSVEVFKGEMSWYLQLSNGLTK